VINNSVSQQTILPAGADSPAGRKSRLVKVLGSALLTVLLGLGIMHLHALPLVQDVKKSFRHSDVNIAAYTFGDEKVYGEILSRGPQYR